MLGLAFPSCNHYTLQWNWNNLACLMVTQLIQIPCVTREFYWWHLLWLFKEKGSETTSFQTSLALQWQGYVGTLLTSGISQLQTKLARHLGCACSNYQQQERNSCSWRVSYGAWAQRQYHSRRKHREELENKKFWKKRIFKLKLVWTLFCSVLWCNFTFCDLFLTFVSEKLTGLFFSPPFFEKKKKNSLLWTNSFPSPQKIMCIKISSESGLPLKDVLCS